jgi:hypothetical protein
MARVRGGRGGSGSGGGVDGVCGGGVGRRVGARRPGSSSRGPSRRTGGGLEEGGAVYGVVGVWGCVLGGLGTAGGGGAGWCGGLTFGVAGRGEAGGWGVGVARNALMDGGGWVLEGAGCEGCGGRGGTGDAVRSAQCADQCRWQLKEVVEWDMRGGL